MLHLDNKRYARTDTGITLVAFVFLLATRLSEFRPQDESLSPDTTLDLLLISLIADLDGGRHPVDNGGRGGHATRQ